MNNADDKTSLKVTVSRGFLSLFFVIQLLLVPKGMHKTISNFSVYSWSYPYS
jgi:hypothetical protein